MTISSEATSITYQGNGVQTNFGFNFLVPSATTGAPEVTVVTVDSAGTVVFVDPSTYQVNGVDDPSGGVIIYPLFGSPLPIGTQLTILRSVPYTQPTSVPNQAFYPKTVEELADVMTMEIQQLREILARAPTVPPGDVVANYIPAKNQRKNRVLGFDAAGNPTTYAAGGGGGGSSDWNDLTNVPFLINAIDNLNPVTGFNSVIQFNAAGVATLIPTPSGTVNSVNGHTGVVVLDYTDVGAAPTVHTHLYPAITNFGDGVNASLLAGSGITFNFSAGVTTINSSAGASSMQPRLMSVFAAIDGGGVNTANNDTAITAAEAAADSAFYWPDGTYKTTLSLTTLSKGYTGRGKLLFGATLYPAKFSYALALPSPAAGTGTGTTGFFSGDQRFGDGGEYKIIGPDIRTYNVNQIYYQSTLLPHFAWFDSLSGSSGGQEYLTSGAAAGATTITVHGTPDAAWVGKQCIITLGFGGSVSETLTVQSINAGAKTITFTTPLAHTYVWNPAAGVNTTPVLTFAPRSWNGHTYIKVRANGGGDTYGHIVRTGMDYVPKTSELQHTFLAGTVGQYGGDVNFNPAASGTYATSMEFAAYDQGADVSYISYVSSFIRNNDAGGANVANPNGGGRSWIGMRLQSAGIRAADVANSVAGNWRYGLDTAAAFLKESTLTLDPILAGAFGFSVYSINGAKTGDPVSISDGVNTYTGTITAVVGLGISVSVAIPFNFAASSYVEFPNGGAIVNAKQGQRIVWNSQVLNQAGNGVSISKLRSVDPLGVFGAFWGNSQGDIETGTDNDGTDYWYTRFNGRGHSGSTARIRLRPTAFQVNVAASFGDVVQATKEVTSSGATFAPGVGGVFGGAFVAGLGTGHYFGFNTTNNRWEFYRAGTLVGTIP